MLHSPALHRVIAAGRRSGKTEDAKRIAILGDRSKRSCVLRPPSMVPNPRYAICGPTRDQVKRIWWNDIKALSPRWAIADISESELWIRYVTGSLLTLIGLDKPMRAEGDPYDGVIIDETQEIKPTAWDDSIYPTLTNRGRPPGWSLRIGRPKGRNHFFKWWTQAKTTPDHDSFMWPSSVVLPRKMIEDAKRDLDPRSFEEQYEAKWLAQLGAVFYAYDANKHARALQYRPDLPLICCFDFNVAPGSAVIVQEQELTPWNNPTGPRHVHTAVIAEVWIRDDSRTELVCERIGAKFAGHKADVHFCGDPSGGKRNTVDTSNDWDVVRQCLRNYFPVVRDRVCRRAPPVIDSANSVNARMLNARGEVRFAIDPVAAPQTVLDLEGVVWEEENQERVIDKSDLGRTHWADALRYYVHDKHPLGGARTVNE